MIRLCGQMLVRRMLRISLQSTAGNVCPSSHIILNRFYSNSRSSASSRAVPSGLTDDQKKLMAIFPEVVRAVVDDVRHPHFEDVLERYAKILEYNVPTGRNLRALSVISACRSLVRSPVCDEDTKSVYVMAWCTEIVMGFIGMVDDCVDGSELRRNLPCWYLIDNVGDKLVIDTQLLDGAIYILLKKFLRDRPYYTRIVNCFRNLTTLTWISMSQEECLTEKFLKTRKFDEFTLETYKKLRELKTITCCYLPIVVSLYFAGISDPEIHRQIQDITFEMGRTYQMQNDYLDCFGELQVTGKGGTDIEGGRCCWPIVTALQLVNGSQKKILEESYGKKNREDVEAVMNVFKDVGLPTLFCEHKKVALNSMRNRIQQLSQIIPPEIFSNIMDFSETQPNFKSNKL